MTSVQRLAHHADLVIGAAFAVLLLVVLAVLVVTDRVRSRRRAHRDRTEGVRVGHRDDGAAGAGPRQ